jgi:hypothetical protein
MQHFELKLWIRLNFLFIKLLHIIIPDTQTRGIKSKIRLLIRRNAHPEIHRVRSNLLLVRFDLFQVIQYWNYIEPFVDQFAQVLGVRGSL